tara:strand:+ start:2115 stop:2348 length:234 start_codon:yes stop_codon:yes gene_type:complete
MTLLQNYKAIKFAKETITNMLNDGNLTSYRLIGDLDSDRFKSDKDNLALEIRNKYRADYADSISVIEVALDDLGLDY